MKCMSFADGVQIFNEPFVSAYHYGSECKHQPPELAKFRDIALANHMELENAFDDSKCTYDWVKQQLEAEYPGKKILLCKDQAYCLDARYDMIPSGLRHAFIIRHPHKVLPSWKRLMTTVLNCDYDTTTWTQLWENRADGFEMQFNLLNHVKENLDPNAIVFDADDLQSNPASILRQFCQGVGIPYTDSLLQWPGSRDIMKTWKASRVSIQGNFLDNQGGFFENALKSERFLPPTAVPELNELPPDLQQVAEYALPFYEQMREMRLRP